MVRLKQTEILAVNVLSWYEPAAAMSNKGPNK